MKKFLAVTPYFGGESSAPRQTELDNVLRYFEYMYSSLKPYMTRLIVSVYNDDDYETIKLYGLNSDIDIIRIKDIDPIFLPANTMRIIQREGFDEEYIYFTESDQIFYTKDINNLYATIDNDKNIYLVPQRFEQIPHAAIPPRIEKYADTTEGRFVEFEGALRGDNNGRFGSDGVCFRNGGSNSISSTRKTYKDIKRKGNSRRELQRRVILRSNSLH